MPKCHPLRGMVVHEQNFVNFQSAKALMNSLCQWEEEEKCSLQYLGLQPYTYCNLKLNQCMETVKSVLQRSNETIRKKQEDLCREEQLNQELFKESVSRSRNSREELNRDMDLEGSRFRADILREKPRVEAFSPEDPAYDGCSSCEGGSLGNYPRPAPNEVDAVDVPKNTSAIRVTAYTPSSVH